MEALLNGLNEQQKEAVTFTEGPSLIIAGAGAGKTRVLTYRIAYLLSLQVPARNILALTFTNKAAREMKERITEMVGRDISKYLWMGTFHSIFARILRIEGEKLGYSPKYTIYDTDDSKSLIKKVIKDHKLDTDVYKPGEILGRISRSKNNLVTPLKYSTDPDYYERDIKSRRPAVAKIYEDYAKRCYRSDAMDFDDLLLNTNILFRDFPDVLEKYQKQFLYILVDEFQDTNYAQNLILLKLSALSRNICVVGDDAQSIYSFRGARIENILNFRNDFQEYKLFKLEQNYRSTKNILDAANSVIEKNNSQIPKRIWSSKDQGHLIKIIKAFTDGEEGYIIANQITDWVRTGRSRFSECAVLYRTNAQSRIIEESLRKRNIPYKVYGGLSFYQRKEVKDLLAYFRLVINHNDDEAFRRIINYPPRGIGKTSVEKMEAAANSRNISLWEAIHLEEGHDLKGAGIARFMEFAAYINDLTGRAAAENAWDFAMHVASTSGILKELYNEKTPEGLSRYENIQEILNSIRDFSDNLLEEEGEEAVRIERYMENVALLTDQDTDKTQDKDRVSLMTIHSAKGLEFDNVFIAGVEEELFPSGYNLLSESDLEEERRLFYVAITRARINVSIGFASSRYKWGSLNSTKPSRFISEIDNKYLDMPPLVRAEIFPGETIFKVKTPIENKKTERPFSSRSLPESNQGKEEQKQIYAGMKVEHAKFGIGKVLSVEGSYPEIKATVFFHNVGQKKLLLKFAHLKVLD